MTRAPAVAIPGEGIEGRYLRLCVVLSALKESVLMAFSVRCILSF